jgi:hypothetical protein
MMPAFIHRSGRLAVLLLATASPLRSTATPPVSAPDPRCSVALRIDARTGRAAWWREGEWRPVHGGTVRGEGPACVEVVGASTAVYRVEISSAPYETASYAALAGFLGHLPHGADILRGAAEAAAFLQGHRPAAGPKVRGDSAEAELRQALQAAVDEAKAQVDGPGGLVDVRNAVLLAAGRMAEAPEETEALAGELRRRLGERLGCVPVEAVPGCEDRLRTTALLTAAFRRVDAAAARLQALPDADDETRELLGTARLVLRTYPEVMAAAQAVQREARLVARAVSVVRWGPVAPEWGKGLAISAAVSPRQEPALAALATLEPRTATVKYELEDVVTFAPGVALLAVPGGRYPSYTSSGGLVAQAGRTDQRLTWAFSLGLTYPALDARARGGPALWLPQLLVAPAADQGPAFGVGTAISWRVARLGLGAAWLRREKLAGLQVGSPLASGAKITTVKAYELAPKLYLDVGLVF